MWARRAILTVVIGFGCYVAYDAVMAGYLTRPKMPEGAFSLSFKNGMRAILVGVPDERETRRYLGFPTDVAFYLKDSWSQCSPPTKAQILEVASTMKSGEWPGARLEAICRIKVDNDVVIRGIIASVPKV